MDAITAPIPLELHAFGLASTLRAARASWGRSRRAPDTPHSPDGGLIADYTGEVGDPAELAARLAAIPGVVDHGLFPAEMVSDVLIGRATPSSVPDGARSPGLPDSSWRSARCRAMAAVVVPAAICLTSDTNVGWGLPAPRPPPRSASAPRWSSSACA